MPSISKKTLTDIKGSKIFEEKFSESLIMVEHKGNEDFGVDYDAEIIDTGDSTTTGGFLNIQLKSHENITFNSSNCYSQSVKVTTANYWLSSNLPVMLVLVDLSTKEIYGVDVKRALRKNWDYKKVESQENISVSISKQDLFSINKCIAAYLDYDQYKFLENSGSDYILFRKFFTYFDSYMRKDPGIVEQGDDATNDVYSFAKKYYRHFIHVGGVVKAYVAMKDTIKKHMSKYERVIYSSFDYYTQEREIFNLAAFNFLKLIVNLINIEIDEDKTELLSYKLRDFSKLKKEIENHPNLDFSYWASLSDSIYLDYDDEES